MTEQQIQKAIFAHLKQRAVPGAFFWHPFSGGFRKPKEAAIYKGLGAIAGLPDVIIVKDGRIFAIELKTTTGRLTDTQRDTHEAMQRAGVTVAVCFGLDAALAQLQEWRLFR